MKKFFVALFLVLIPALLASPVTYLLGLLAGHIFHFTCNYWICLLISLGLSSNNYVSREKKKG